MEIDSRGSQRGGHRASSSDSCSGSHKGSYIESGCGSGSSGGSGSGRVVLVAVAVASWGWNSMLQQGQSVLQRRNCFEKLLCEATLHVVLSLLIISELLNPALVSSCVSDVS